MSVTTGKGDEGFTGFPAYRNSGGQRVRKDDISIAVIGTLDELDAILALAVIALRSGGSVRLEELAALVEQIRKTLFRSAMSAIAEVSGETARADTSARASARELTLNTLWLEQKIAELETTYSSAGFVWNWTRPAAAELNLARAVCRRCERLMVHAAANHSGGESAQNNAQTMNPHTNPQLVDIQWINRLSDLLFLLAVSAENS